jgi:hypothetical protein
MGQGVVLQWHATAGVGQAELLSKEEFEWNIATV